MAKRFFYVCAGLFLLALSYHLGAHNVTAQSSAIQGGMVGFESQGFSGASGRLVHVMNSGGAAGRIGAPVPGDAAIIATSFRGDVENPQGFVLLENEDAYLSSGAAWLFVGNLFDAPTASRSESWGKVKDRYRK